MSKNDEKYKKFENLNIKIKDEPADEATTSIFPQNLQSIPIKQEPEEDFELQIPITPEIKTEDSDDDDDGEDIEAARSCKKLVIFPKEYEKTAPHMCQICGKRFSDKKVLQQHKMTHEKMTICEICKVEIKQNLLNSHIKNNHESRKNFECPTCHAQFKIETNLQHHMKKHEVKFVYKIEK